MSTKLTPHFTLEELTATKTGLSNIPNVSQTNQLRKLCRDILEPIREKIDMPILVNSGFRSPEVNKVVGGVSTSQHLLGQAADIIVPNYIDSLSYLHLYNLISNMVINGKLNVGQCILYKKSHFIHVSLPSLIHENDFLKLNK